MELVRTIVFQARNREAEPAVAFPGGVATYGALMKSTWAAVEAIRTFDLPPGAPVMIDIRNPIHHTAMFFALALLGLPSASVGTAFVAEKAGYLPQLFLTDRADAQGAGIRTIQVDDRWFTVDPVTRPNYSGLLALPSFPGPDSIVRFVYSSGTTGHPKCVGLTEACFNLRFQHLMAARSWWMEGATIVNMMGFSTIAGTMQMLRFHSSGALLAYAGDPAEVGQMLRLFRANGLIASTGHLQALLKTLGDSKPPPSLQLVAVAGAKISRRMLQQVRMRLCSTVVMNYGSTELGPVSLGMASDVDTEDGFVGHVLPWVEVQVVDEIGEVQPVGREGIFRVKSPEAALYISAGGDRQELHEDGWFYPGDVGRLGADGTIYVTGRSSEVINRGGSVVAPEVIEDVLRLNPNIADVAVVGITNADGVEEIWAAVVSDRLIDPAAVIAAARPRLNEKVPDHVVQVPSIPRAESAKVRRFQLREILQARKHASG